MNICVCVKRVPDTESRLRLAPDRKSVSEDGLNFILSPYDEYAVEEALRLREATGGSVRVLTVGREDAVPLLRKTLAMGADEAVLVKDEAGETYDGLRTARIIAAAIAKKFPGFDLVLFGRQSAGADNAQVPSMVAELLGIPQVNIVTKLAIEGGRGPAVREVEGGCEKVAFSLPAVLSAQKGLNEPRYETLKGIMAAKRKEIPVVPVAELGLPSEALVPAIEVAGIDFPAERKAGRLLTGDPAETARELARLLHEEAKVV
jgi:electron transfer flavoprotein beta subunit